MKGSLLSDAGENGAGVELRQVVLSRSVVSLSGRFCLTNVLSSFVCGLVVPVVELLLGVVQGGVHGVHQAELVLLVLLTLPEMVLFLEVF